MARIRSMKNQRERTEQEAEDHRIICNPWCHAPKIAISIIPLISLTPSPKPSYGLTLLPSYGLTPKKRGHQASTWHPKNPKKPIENYVFEMISILNHQLLIH
jgi:hypothetical protein